MARRDRVGEGIFLAFICAVVGAIIGGILFGTNLMLDLIKEPSLLVFVALGAAFGAAFGFLRGLNGAYRTLTPQEPDRYGRIENDDDQKERAMTMKKLLLAALAWSALAACTPPTKDAAEEPAKVGELAPPTGTAADPEADAAGPSPPTTPEPPVADCAVAEYESLIGSNVAAVTLPADLVHRIYKQGDPVTMDYRSDRLNIVTDANGVIVEVKCG